MSYRIPFNRPFFAGREQEYMADAIARGQISGNGHFSRRCEALLGDALEGARVMLTTSCTDALEMAALLLGLEPGDEVIVPSFTFSSTANAFALHGAKPIFIDIRPDTLNLDADRLEERITERTRAIVPVHYAGVGCEMERISRIAAERSLVVIEDNAHGLFGRYRERPLGTFGSLSTLSFHETKNFSCGEGGALVVNEADFVARAEILRDKGTNRAEFFRGAVQRYTWVDLGSSFLPSDLLAAFLYAQLEERSQIQAQRQRIWEHYARELEEWAGVSGVRLPGIPEGCELSYHLFYLILPTRGLRDELIQHLKEDGILAVSHYEPLHSSPMGQRSGAAHGDCPVAEDLSGRLLRLPFYNALGQEDLACVTARVRSFKVATKGR